MDTQTLETAAVMGGTSVTVTHLDGTAEAVTVRAFTLREITQYVDAMTDPYSLAAVLTDHSVEWAESLTDDSVCDINDAGETLNFRKAMREAGRLARIIDRLQVEAPQAVKAAASPSDALQRARESSLAKRRARS